MEQLKTGGAVTAHTQFMLAPASADALTRVVHLLTASPHTIWGLLVPTGAFNTCVVCSGAFLAARRLSD